MTIIQTNKNLPVYGLRQNVRELLSGLKVKAQSLDLCDSIQFLTKKVILWMVSGTYTNGARLSIESGITLFPDVLMKIDEHLKLDKLFKIKVTRPGGDEEISKLVHKIAQEMGISKPINILVYDNPSCPFACLGSALGSGSPIVYIGQSSQEITHEHEFALRHEMAHIHNNDTLFLNLIYVGTLIVMGLVFEQIVGAPETAAGQLFKGAICDIFATFLFLLCSRFAEMRADVTAVAMSTNKETAKGGISFFEKVIKHHLGILEKATNDENHGMRWLNQKTIEKCGITQDGNISDLSHPPLTVRKAVLQQL